MKKILITGGFGFLGTQLTDLLSRDKNASVHVVDSLATNPVDLDYYLDEIGRPNNLTYTISTVEAYFAKYGFTKYDEIYHLASPVGPAGVLAHAGNMVREIVRDTYLMIDYCLKMKAKLLDVSTSEVYGGGQQGYCPESTPKIVPPKTTVRLEYAMGKLAAETAVTNMCRVHGLKAVIVRPFNVAGQRQSPKGGFVLPRFLQQADAGLPLTVFGDGSAIRAFTHVEDMVEGIRLALAHGTYGEAYNIGNPHNRTTILELAKKVIQITGSKSRIEHVDPKTIYGPLFEDANDKYPDAKLAMSQLGWAPKHDIDRIIRDTYDDFKRQKQKGVLKDNVAGGAVSPAK